MTPYTYTNNNPINLIDPTGMKGEDWVKRGEQIFYDENIKSRTDAEKTYGKGTEHLGGGSSLITSQGNKIISKYTFHSNGTYIDMNNNVIIYIEEENRVISFYIRGDWQPTTIGLFAATIKNNLNNWKEINNELEESDNKKIILWFEENILKKLEDKNTIINKEDW